ncbi:phosphorylase kinase regulatory subunit beta [Phyllostomus discolor]|uniref:Phosphorylase b kinase regulatory subunit n=1 Tax=Phyllostomus discolor TaxID=89673 RepID=A0A834DGG1_9CHIR|nr:phosphorylase kinase regulatory subunit beta [Phyllostomus discolor]
MARSPGAAASSPPALLRSGSVYEPLKSIHLPRPDHGTLWDRLDRYYGIVKATLLRYQSPTTGLFPTKTCGDDQKAKVHDSLYCAAAAWALALAYRRLDDDQGRTHELEHSAVKCMRGVLYCYMRQADKVQQFKQDPRPTTCLHSIFHVRTGDELLTCEEYGHLQINAVSLYLLYLVEMTSSGLQIIYNTDEVSFIQNLVFCVERVYRVPDFGVWERGSKYNNGSTELHSSSVGLAKAALEAINGFNLFGSQGCSWSVIFVDLDAHNRNRQTLCSLLPRESRSHNTDAALLPCISYPAFALDDEALFMQTLDKVVRKLKGKYGFKRFLRDGYRTSLEDPNRRYYKPAEIKLFDGIECEFPIFFLYMMIDGVFRGDAQQVKEYRDLLTPVLHQTTEGTAGSLFQDIFPLTFSQCSSETCK